ncbi:hypothetical protein [Miniphocaeibacter halophilus]|uniref:Uncharacterized protein n=1 Tax=Miniphocaeibacter halophilus TaxID=2931922 RepID=A0AC61MRI3_9FIRM|nr:hypothetical protein [Miniphocaeibacter halophilus]QQK08157.1 hypothetical protein JFY71_01075 [Miniphocaeibacter halophilus]
MELIKQLIVKLMTNNNFIKLSFIISILMTIYIIYFYLSKEGKDERGRKIYGESAFLGFLLYIFVSNVLPFLLPFEIDLDVLLFYAISTYFSLVCPTFIFILIKKKYE